MCYYSDRKKKSGIKSIEKIFSKEIINFKKKDNARKCILFQGILLKNIAFHLKDFIKIEQWNQFKIQTLPGVFGYKKIDNGTKFLLSTFKKNIKGKILEIGSGSGIISIFLKKYFPSIEIHMVDTYYCALLCSKETFNLNNANGIIYASNIYSNISEKFDLIISNPPIHDDLKYSKKMIIQIIQESPKFLKKNGELRLITHSFQKYDNYFQKTFKTFNILLKNKTYKIYQAFYKKI